MHHVCPLTPVCVRVPAQVRRESIDTRQARAEEMKLCLPGDLIGATTYSLGQGNLHYAV